MGERLAEIRDALDRFQMDWARELADQELRENPSAEAFHLASQAALNQGQRMAFLEKALELDSTYQPVLDELAEMKPKPKPSHEAKVETVAEPMIVETAPRQEAAPAMDPEAAGPRRAGFGRRWLAIMIDGVVIAIPTLMLVGVSGISATMEAALLADDAAAMSAAFSGFQSEVVKLNLLVSAVYNVVLMRAFNGQTLGKIVLGLRVVKKNGKRIGILDALIRNVFGYTISGFFLLGYLWALVDRERQAWHDKLVGTVVVDERAWK